MMPALLVTLLVMPLLLALPPHGLLLPQEYQRRAELFSTAVTAIAAHNAGALRPTPLPLPLPQPGCLLTSPALNPKP